MAAFAGHAATGPSVNSWTRTLNLDDAHTLLALAEVGQSLDDWTRDCHAALPALSMARRRELIRMLRDGFMTVEDGRLGESLFFRFYQRAAADAQLDLVQLQWALSHPLSLIAVERLVAHALDHDTEDIPLNAVENLVAKHLSTSSAESRRKTRTVLLGALEGIGVLQTRGTGQHRTLRATRANPHPLAFGFLVQRDLSLRGIDGMMASEASESSLAVRLTQCSPDHAEHCLKWNLANGILHLQDDEVRAAA